MIPVWKMQQTFEQIPTNLQKYIFILSNENNDVIHALAKYVHKGICAVAVKYRTIGVYTVGCVHQCIFHFF